MRLSKIINCCIIFILIGCKNNDSIELKLKSSSITKININDFRIDEKILYSYKKHYPKLYKEKLNRFKGIPKLDSFSIVSASFQKVPVSFYAYKNGDIDDVEYSKIKNQLTKIDSIVLNSKYIKFEINAISGFSNNKQIVIVDSNNNYDFSDDKNFYFDINFGLDNDDSENFIKKLPIVNLSYEILDNGKLFKIEKELKIYPILNHKYAYLFLWNRIDTLLNNYTLQAKFTDIKEASFKRNKQNYKVFLKGFTNNSSILAIKPIEISDTISSTELFSYTFSNRDTIKLPNDYFKINIAKDLSTLNFQPIKAKQKYGYRTGNIIKNIVSKNIINDKRFDLYGIIKKKKYTLIDFWGTWCKPCIELTPSLKTINKRYKNKLSIVSIAYDKEIDKVAKYIKNNNLDWYHTFINKKGNSENIAPIRDLKINSFPTFILINNKNKIIFRGGSNEFYKIKDLLEQD